MQLLGGDERKAVGEVETHLVAEDGEGPGAGPVLLLHPFFEDAGEELVIGLHGSDYAASRGAFTRLYGLSPKRIPKWT